MSQMLIVNPRKRRKAPKSKSKARKRRTTVTAATNPKPRRRRRSSGSVGSVVRYRRNPRGAGGVLGAVKGAIVPAAIAAAGAVGSDVLLGYLPLPARLKSGNLRHVTRAGAAILSGVVAGFVAKPETARLIMSGGLTVALHGAMRDVLQRTAPAVRLANMAEDNVDGIDDDLGALLSNDMAGFEYDPSVAGFDPPLGDTDYLADSI